MMINMMYTISVLQMRNLVRRKLEKLFKVTVCSCSSHICTTHGSRSYSTHDAHRSSEDIASHIKCGDYNKIVVMAGAGMGTPSGLRDFRSPGTGLYDNLQEYKEYNLPYKEALFDIRYFSKEPRPFFSYVRNSHLRLASNKRRPNITHYFVQLLQEKGKLLRMYTQNVDGLDRLAGISDDLLVEAHGTSLTATCRLCKTTYRKSDILETIMAGDIPRCAQSSCDGVIKPDIVFFGEQLPARFWNFTDDLPKSDLLMVIGTSLEVQPFCTIADIAPHGIPRILFNYHASGTFKRRPRSNDVIVEGDIAETFHKFCAMLGWNEEINQLKESTEKGLSQSS